MKPSHFFVTVGLAAACFILSVTLIVIGLRYNGLQADVQRLQAEVQTQQQQIDGGSAVSRIAPNLVREIVAMSADNPAMKAILTKHGYNPGGSTTPSNP
jgi:hypothetical protein